MSLVTQTNKLVSIFLQLKFYKSNTATLDKTQLIHRTPNTSAYTAYNEGKLNGTTREDQNGMQ